MASTSFLRTWLNYSRSRPAQCIVLSVSGPGCLSKKFSAMEAADIFRKLATNQYMQHLDYYGTRFKFKTVWYTTAYSYCLCPCSFDHEYVKYITENGVIVEQIYNKVLECILNGTCPHVDHVADKYVTESVTNALNIAIVAGTTDALRKPLITDDYVREGLGCFHLSPYRIALLKNPDIANPDIALEDFPCWQIEGMYPLVPEWPMIKADKCMNESTDQIQIEEMTTVEFCVRRNYECMAVLKSRVSYDNVTSWDMFKATEAALRYNCPDLVDSFLDLVTFYFGDLDWDIWDMCEAAAFFSKPTYLEGILKKEFESHELFHYPLWDNLYNLSDALERNACKDIVLKFRSAPQEISKAEKVKQLLYLFIRFNCCPVEVIPVLKGIPDITPSMNQLYTEANNGNCLHLFNKECYESSAFKRYKFRDLDSRTLKKMLDLGADVNFKDADNMTPLQHLLSIRCDENQVFRDAEELYVFENPSLDDSMVSFGVEADKVSYILGQDADPFVGGRVHVYNMDSKEHAVRGHGGANFALNFMVPFLIESGCEVSETVRNELISEMEFLHPAEQEFVKKYLERPRPLMTICRDSLRKHYRGRQIHKFVESVNIPWPIKDFILLKQLLKSVPEDL